MEREEYIKAILEQHLLTSNYKQLSKAKVTNLIEEYAFKLTEILQ